jgi:hypothetical protein
MAASKCSFPIVLPIIALPPLPIPLFPIPKLTFTLAINLSIPCPLD